MTDGHVPYTADYEYCDGPQTPEIRQLVAYWEQLRGARFAPGRAEFDPPAIRPLLPHISMIDVLDGGSDFRFRLIGTHIVEGLGRDNTGRLFSQVYADQPAVLERMLERMNRVIRLRQPQFTCGRCYWHPDRAYKGFDDVNLPLSSDGQHVDIILGALVIHRAS